MTAFQEQEWLTIAGVVGDVRQEGPERQALPLIYRWYLQAGTQFMALLLHTNGDPMKMAPAVRGQVMSVERDQPAFGITTLEKMLEETLGSRRTNLSLLGVLALFALILASVVIYSVVSYRVSRQTHEIGIRIAIGARPVRVIGMIVGRTMIHALAGVLVGLAAAAAVTRFLSGMLYGGSATDPATLAAISLLPAGVVLAAGTLPSLHAARVEPMEALRHE